jgi:hypothetical protein
LWHANSPCSSAHTESRCMLASPRNNRAEPGVLDKNPPIPFGVLRAFVGERT